MRIATTLMLGAAALVLAAAPMSAQPAVAPQPAKQQPARQAVTPPPGAQPPAPVVATNAAPGAAPTASDDPPTAQPDAARAQAAEDTDAPPTTDAPAAASSAPPTAQGATFTPAPAAAKPATPPAVSGAAEASPPAGTKASAKPEAETEQAEAEPVGNPDDFNSVAATVNDESISDFEVRQRMALYLATSGLTNLTPPQRKRIRTQILEQLETEKIQLQEAVKKKITVSPVEVDRRINAMISENRFTIEQLRDQLKRAGASEEAMRSQITAAIAWQKAVQDEYGDRVTITPDMVDAEMRRHAEGAHKPRFHVLEIFLPVDNPEQDAKVRKDIEEILDQMKKGAPFPIIARQFSQHPTAASGGDMGWIIEGQLAPELNAALSKMQPGSISPPIRAAGGWYVIALRARQEPLGTKIAEAPKGPTGPAGTLPLARLLLPLPPNAPKSELEQVINVATQIRERISSCEQMDEMHGRMKGTVYMNLGNAKLEELSPQIQAAMKNSQPGDVAMPFQSEAGVELIARCDQRVVQQTAYVMPTRQEVEDQLFQNQIAALARRYLRDLKRAANIQVRDDSKPDALIR